MCGGRGWGCHCRQQQAASERLENQNSARAESTGFCVAVVPVCGVCHPFPRRRIHVSIHVRLSGASRLSAAASHV